MALTISGTTSSWNLSGLVILPTGSQTGGSGGNNQALAASLIVSSTTSSWSIASPQVAQPSISQQRGAGGATQTASAGLIISGTTSSWSKAFFDAAFTFTITNALVVFTDASGGSPDSFSWDFGDGSTTPGIGPTTSHIYNAQGVVTVTESARRVKGFENTPLVSTQQAQVTLGSALTPDESLSEVLNREIGFHAYEPVRQTTADTGDVRTFYNEVLNIASGAQTTALNYAPDVSIRVRQITATGSGDGLFQLVLNGKIIDVKRNHISNRNVRFDIEDDLKLATTDSLQVLVTNASQNPQSYQASILGRTV